MNFILHVPKDEIYNVLDFIYNEALNNLNTNKMLNNLHLIQILHELIFIMYYYQMVNPYIEVIIILNY